MTKEKIEKAAEWLGDLVSEAYSSVETLSDIRGILNKILDEYILIKRPDADRLLKLVKSEEYSYYDDPRHSGSENPYSPLIEALEEALLE